MGLIEAYKEARAKDNDLLENAGPAQRREWARFTTLNRLAAILGTLNDEHQKASYELVRIIVLTFGFGEEMINTFRFGPPSVRALNELKKAVMASKSINQRM